ncbi:uncharacterized protein LOC132067265 [Lycium ferocissimum]|uniref:uncharacterized protein LOC132067265 n=1 Tax=Lycium ferocissimum TaxID=112874 RepID=UPI00281684CE|nr:uncharacterized protein LOC132067265 [Lycium ferocissimum]
MGSNINNNGNETLFGVTSSTEGFTPFSVDSTHAFYVRPSDSPGNRLVYDIFDGNKFVLWHRNMLIALSAKNKLGILTGKEAQPTPESPSYPYWEQCNDMVIAWITNSLYKDISSSLMGFSTAKDIWTDINKRFGQSNGSKYIQLQRELDTITHGSSDIAAYFTRLRTLWDKLSNAYVGPDYSYGALAKHLEEQKLYQFLGGLNDSYTTCKSAIMLMSPLSSISRAYAMLQHDEKQKEASSPIPSFSNESASFSASSSHQNNPRGFRQRIQFDSKKSFPPFSSPQVSSLFCKYRKKSRHIIDKCYRLHGYPPDFKFTKNKKVASCV